MACTHTVNCQLYAQFAADASLKLWKQHFCEGGFQKCARYRLALEGKSVPLTLLPNGKLVERRSEEQINASALFNAILKQRVPVVRSLIKTRMASFQLKNQDGMTPLMLAASVGNPELVELLLEHGCDPYSVNKDSRRPVDIARHHGFLDCAKMIDRYMATHPQHALHSTGAEDDDAPMTEVLGLLRKLNPFR